MQNDLLYQSLSLVSNLQRELDVCRYQLDNILLNLKCGSFQSSINDVRHHKGFETAQSFFSFMYKHHPEIMDEWLETNNKTK